MARRGVATAFADIRADLTRFDADLNEARARLIVAMRELDKLAVVNLRADTTAASAGLKKIQAEAKAAGSEAVVKVTAETAEATAALSGVEEEAKAVGALDPTIRVDADAAEAAAQLRAIEADAAALSGTVSSIRVTATAEQAAAELAAIEAEAAAVAALDPNIVVTAQTEQATPALAAVEAEARAVGATDPVVRVSTAGTETAALKLEAVREKAASIMGAETIAALAAGAAKISLITAGLGVVISGFALRATGQMEKIEVAFRGILGATEGDSFLAELKQFAAVTPFQLTQVTDAAQQLLAAFGPEAKEKILPTLTAIGDIVSVTGGGALQIDRVTLALTQMQGKGKVATQELNQLREALPGFNAIAPIAKALGVTIPEAMKQVELRTVDADVAIRAILEGMKEYPGAAGAMDRTSKTLIGRLSTLKDVARFAAIEGFESLNTAAKNTLEGVISTFTSGALQAPFQALSDALGNLLTTLVPAIISAIGPLATGFASIINPLADVLKVIIPAAVQLVPVLGELIGTLLKAIPLDVVQTIFDGLASGIKLLNDALQALGTTGTGALIGFTAALVALTTGGPLTAVIAGITLLGTLLETFNGGQREIERNIDNVAAALGRQTDALLTNKDAVIQLGKSATITVQELIKMSTLEGLGKGADDLERVFGRLGLSMGQLVPIIEAIRRKGALKVEELTDPAAIAAFGQLADKMGLTSEQMDTLFVIAERGKGGLSDLSRAAAGNAEALAKMQGAFGVDRINALIPAVKAGGSAFLAQSHDLETLVSTLDRLPVEKSIREFLEQKSAVLDGGQAFLDAALNGRTLEEATKTVASAQALLTDFISRAGFAASVAGIDFETLAKSMEGEGFAAEGAAAATEKAEAAFSALSTPAERLAETVKNAKDALADFDTNLDIAQSAVDFAQPVVDAEEAVGELSTSTDRASEAVSRFKSELDRLEGKKLDLTEAQLAMEHLLQTAKDFAGTSLDFHTEAGLKNLDSLVDRIKAAHDIATATFDATGDPAKAAEAYALNIDRIRSQFAQTGGDVTALNKKLEELGSTPTQFKIELDQVSVDKTKEVLVEDLAKITETNPVVSVQIAAQIDKGNLAIADAAFDALTKAPDKGPRVAEILATVVDEDTAKKALEDLAALTPAAKGGFDLAVADGVKNTGDLIDKLKAAKDQALFVFGQTGSATKATETYAEIVGDIGTQFQNSGGDIDAFNAKLTEFGARPFDFRVALEPASKTELLKEIGTLEETSPQIAAELTTTVNQGDLDVAVAALDALKSDPNNAPRVAEILASIDPFSQATTEQALRDLAALKLEATVGVSASDQDIETVLGQLAILDNNITPEVIPHFDDATLQAIMGDLAVISGTPIPLKLTFPQRVFGFGSEQGNFFQSFLAGGRPRGRNIREMASNYYSGAKTQYAFGEPSTHGEFFLSMAPQWRERNKELHEQAGRMLYGSEYTVNARGLESAVDKLAGVVHSLTPAAQRRERAEHGQRVLNMAAGAVTVVSPKPALAGRALIDELTSRGM